MTNASFVSFGGVETAPAVEGVVGNDSDPEGDSLAAILVSGPTNAAAFNLNADGTFSYTPTADFSGVDSFSYKASDGSGDSNVVVATITVNAINDPPTNSVPGPQSVDEDTALVFNATNGNLISINDVDGGTDEMAVVLTVNDGALTLSGTAGLSFVAGSNGSSSMTVSGSLDDLNAALDGMTFMPDPEFSGPVNLEMTTHDDTGLVAHYGFDDLANLGDDDGFLGTNDGVVSGALSVNDGIRGDVLSFDGVDDGVQIAGLMGQPANVTVAAWVNMTAGAAPGEVITIGDSFILRADSWSSSGVRAAYYDGSSWNDLWSNVEVNGTGWRHLAAAFDDANDTLEIFIDGVSVASVTTRRRPRVRPRLDGDRDRPGDEHATPCRRRQRGHHRRPGERCSNVLRVR
jgi:hypothetical protein